MDAATAAGVLAVTATADGLVVDAATTRWWRARAGSSTGEPVRFVSPHLLHPTRGTIH
jgi:hypothetical protein